QNPRRGEFGPWRAFTATRGAPVSQIRDTARRVVEGGQPYDEFAAFAGAAAAGFDAAAVQLDDSPHECQPDAKSALSAVDLGVALHEKVEDFREEFFGDAGAAVADSQDDVAALAAGVHG